jgi:hypothetical protein
VSVEKFERTGNLIRLGLRHEVAPESERQAARLRELKGFKLIDEVRRLTVRYEEARKRDTDSENEKRWLLVIAQHLAARAGLESDENEVRMLRDQARERVQAARKLYAADVASARTKFEAFPEFISPDENQELFNEKRQAETRYTHSQLHLATCTMVEALCEPPQSDKRADQLSAAASEFEAFHRQYRTQLAGVHGRLLQGRCLQLLGNLEAAEGIYAELQQVPGSNGTAASLRNLAMYFSLTSLNERGERQLVMTRAAKWLADAPIDRRRSVGRGGIIWEETRAMQGVASEPTLRLLPELTASGSSELLLEPALLILQEVQQSPNNEHAGLAAKRIQEVFELLHAGQGVPSGYSICFQAPLAELPADTYRVEVTVTSHDGDKTTPETPVRFSGQITTPAPATN